MKSYLQATALAACLALPAAAQQAEEEDSFNLMEEGARLFFRGLMDEMEPALRELEGMAREIEPNLRSFVREMGPALRELMTEVEDWSAYHPPEILPNGDIIIRRKTPQEMLDAPVTGEDEIEL
ncbi:hypothetical protein [Marinovum sp.]|uniref:hypothetical protein n=1 Tax=Marinovum sp. TaxID=2024839 RepID=UPI002B26C9C2|nr:hypothetical protein [Marinovum sp.]